MLYNSFHILHAQILTGPIVRVAPNELHVAEDLFYHTRFVPATVRKTDNYTRFGQGTGIEGKLVSQHCGPRSRLKLRLMIDMTAISTAHDKHRRLRAPLEPFFSRAGITNVEVRILARVKKLCDRLDAAQNTVQVVNLAYALSSLTGGTSKANIDAETVSILTKSVWQM